MTDGTLLALDVGEKRIGVALASLGARLPHPHGVVAGGEAAVADIQKLIEDEDVKILVVGLPRGLEGQETKQTHAVRQFANSLAATLSIPMYLQDEALTSHYAEEELHARGKSYQKGDIDALAATTILQDFITEHPELINEK